MFLLRWLKGLLPSRRRSPIPRAIFHYFNGSLTRSIDPMLVEQYLGEQIGPDWREQYSQLLRPIKPTVMGIAKATAERNRSAARKAFLDAIGVAFEVVPYNDGTEEGVKPYGLTELERLSLLTGYIRFCLEVVRAARPFGYVRSRASPSTETPPTSSGSDSSSPVTESSGSETSKQPEPS